MSTIGPAVITETIGTRLLSTTDAAEYLGIHVETLRRHVRENTIPAHRVGGALRFSSVELAKYLESTSTGRA